MFTYQMNYVKSFEYTVLWTQEQVRFFLKIWWREKIKDNILTHNDRTAVKYIVVAETSEEQENLLDYSVEISQPSAV